jgi:hypothetical protein
MSRNLCFCFRFEYDVFYVLYPFMTYLLTLPRNSFHFRQVRRVSSVNTGHTLDHRGSYSISSCVQTGFRAHTTSYPIATMGSFQGINQPVLETDHSSPSTAEAKNTRCYISTPAYFCLAWCFLKHRGRSGFTFTSDKYIRLS